MTQKSSQDQAGQYEEALARWQLRQAQQAFRWGQELGALAQLEREALIEFPVAPVQESPVRPDGVAAFSRRATERLASSGVDSKVAQIMGGLQAV